MQYNGDKAEKYPTSQFFLALIFIIGVAVVTYILSGLNINCTKKAEGICVRKDYTENLETDSAYRTKKTYFGTYNYEVDGVMYGWTDDRFIPTNPTEGKTYTLYVDPDNPKNATMINYFVIVCGVIFELVFIYALAVIIITNAGYYLKRR